MNFALKPKEFNLIFMFCLRGYNASLASWFFGFWRLKKKQSDTRNCIINKMLSYHHCRHTQKQTWCQIKICWIVFIWIISLFYLRHANNYLRVLCIRKLSNHSVEHETWSIKVPCALEDCFNCSIHVIGLVYRNY